MTQILDVTTSEDVCTRQRTKVLHYSLPDTNNRLLKANNICMYLQTNELTYLKLRHK